jgi:hypothetical protein
MRLNSKGRSTSAKRLEEYLFRQRARIKSFKSLAGGIIFPLLITPCTSLCLLNNYERNRTKVKKPIRDKKKPIDETFTL